MLRTIKKAFEEIQKADPNTSVTVYTIRKWCKDGLIRYLTVGSKILVDMGSLNDFITNR